MGGSFKQGIAVTVFACAGLLGCGGGGKTGDPLPAPQAPHIVSVMPERWPAQSEAQFSAVVEGATPISYVWNFGDACTPSTSTGAAPRVQLAGVGTYQASLTVANALGSDTYSWEFDAVGYVVQGSVSTYGGRSLESVTLNFSGGLEPVTTDINGQWWRDDIATGTYTVTPSRGDWAFDPETREFTVDGAEVGGLAFTFTGVRQTPDDWIHSWSSNDAGDGVDVAADGSGNIFVLGAGGVVLKYSPAGDLLWAHQWVLGPGMTYDYSNSFSAMALDGQGRIYLCGTADTGDSPLRRVIACLSPEGDPVWQMEFAQFEPEDVQISDTGEVYLAGYYRAAGSYEYLISLVVLSSTGELQRKTAWNCGQDVDVNRLALNSAQDACIVGGLGSYAMLCLCVDSQDNVKWANSWDGWSTDKATAVAADSDGGFYVAGSTAEDDSNDDYRHGSVFMKLSAGGYSKWQYVVPNSGYYDGANENLCVAGPDDLFIGWDLPFLTGSSSDRHSVLRLKNGFMPGMASCLVHPSFLSPRIMVLGPAGELILTGNVEDASCYWDSVILEPVELVGSLTALSVEKLVAEITVTPVEAMTDQVIGSEDQGSLEGYYQRALLTVKHTP